VALPECGRHRARRRGRRGLQPESFGGLRGDAQARASSPAGRNVRGRTQPELPAVQPRVLVPQEGAGNSGRTCQPPTSTRLITRMSDPRHPVYLSYRRARPRTSRHRSRRRAQRMKTGEIDTLTTKTGQTVDLRLRTPVLRRPQASRPRSSVHNPALAPAVVAKWRAFSRHAGPRRWIDPRV
jgi:hypothetical protein